METKKLSNEELLNLIKEKSKREKALTLEVINLIREVESRRLFLKLGFGSLFEYVTKELSYEEAAALRRISAARLIRDIPEVEDQVREGKLSLSNIAQAQNFFRREEKLQTAKMTVEQKREILSELENKSTREAQKTLLKISPEQVVFVESQKIISEEHIEMKMVISDKLKAKLEKLKLLLSHKNPRMSYSELFEELADIAIKKLDPIKTEQPKMSESSNKGNSSQSINARNLPSAQKVQKDTRHIPAEMKRHIWKRDQGKCTYRDPLTHRQCESRFQLEIHHHEPFAMGGETSLENLSLVCRKHNALIAVKDFGKNKMQLFMSSLQQ